MDLFQIRLYLGLGVIYEEELFETTPISKIDNADSSSDNEQIFDVLTVLRSCQTGPEADQSANTARSVKEACNEAELSAYDNIPEVTHTNVCPLKWCKDNKTIPLLRKFARRILSRPGSTGAAESSVNSPQLATL